MVMSPLVEEKQPDLVVGAIIVNHGGDILLIQQKKWRDQYSCFVGGHIKRGETKVEALRREIREEVDIDITDCKSIGDEELIQQNDFGEPIHYVFFNYVCFVNSSYFHYEEGGEIEDAKWEMPERAVDIVIESNKTILQKLLHEGILGSTSGKRRAMAKV